MAIAMIFSLSATAFATGESVNVTINLQSATSIAEGVLTDVNPIVTGLTILATDRDNDGNVTLYEALLDLKQSTVGNNALFTNFAYDVVDVYDTTTWSVIGTGKAITSITYNGTPYSSISESEYYYDLDGNVIGGDYEGYNWEIFVNNQYSYAYMDYIVLSNNDQITLSYDYSTFSWGSTN